MSVEEASLGTKSSVQAPEVSCTTIQFCHHRGNLSKREHPSKLITATAAQMGRLHGLNRIYKTIKEKNEDPAHIKTFSGNYYKELYSCLQGVTEKDNC